MFFKLYDLWSHVVFCVILGGYLNRGNLKSSLLQPCVNLAYRSIKYENREVQVTRRQVIKTKHWKEECVGVANWNSYLFQMRRDFIWLQWLKVRASVPCKGPGSEVESLVTRRQTREGWLAIHAVRQQLILTEKHFIKLLPQWCSPFFFKG